MLRGAEVRMIVVVKGTVERDLTVVWNGRLARRRDPGISA